MLTFIAWQRFDWTIYWRNYCPFYAKYTCISSSNLYSQLLHFIWEFLQHLAWLLITICRFVCVTNMTVWLDLLKELLSCFTQNFSSKSLYVKLQCFKLEFLQTLYACLLLFVYHYSSLITPRDDRMWGRHNFML